MKLLLPDALWHPAQLSGASFLYFHDEKLVFTLHPSVSSFLTGIDHFTYLAYLEKESPTWKPEFMKFFNLWHGHQESLHGTYELLKPLQGSAFSTILFSYDRGKRAWQYSEEILSSSSLDIDQIAELIDPFHAADELFAHIFFEKVLEVQHSGKGEDFYVNLGKEFAKCKSEGIEPKKDFDWKPIHDYCNELFTRHTVDQLLTRAYMFRMPILRHSNELFLSNEKLPAFLVSLPVKHSGAEADLEDSGEILDVVAWEFFRHLLSNHVDPLAPEKVQTIRTIISRRRDEINRLKHKCYELAEDIGSEGDIERLTALVANHIKAKVENDLYDLLQIDKQVFQDFIGELFSDQKTWIAIATFLASLLYGGEVLTAGSAIVALSSFGSKAFKQAAIKKKRLQCSAYSLIYRMKSQ